MNAEVSATIATGILFIVAYAWIALFAKLLRGRAILPLEPRRETPWGLISVILSFFLLIVSQILAAVAFAAGPDTEPTVAQTGALLTCTAIVILVATSISIGLIHLFTKASRADFGISLDHVPRDLFIGVYAFLILAPVTFAIQFVFVYVLGLESHHPLIELLKEDSSGKLFGVVTVLAVVVAPISEEYFFRVLLQGWLERVFRFRSTQRVEAEPPAQSDIAQTGEVKTQQLDEITLESDANPYASPTLFDTSDDNPGDDSSVALIVPTASFVPIVISAALFAMMHWSHGPDPAALFVLALGLGYLYQRTHRWLPCVVTHACLNGTTMLMLWYGLDELPP